MERNFRIFLLLYPANASFLSKYDANIKMPTPNGEREWKRESSIQLGKLNEKGIPTNCINQ